MKTIAFYFALALSSGPAWAQAEFNLSILDLTITQDDGSLTINELPSDWPLTYGITVKPGPISIIVPMEGCDPAAEGTYLRVYGMSLAQDLVSELVNLRDTTREGDPMDILFQPGTGFAVVAGPQRILFADDAMSARFDQGVNAFFEDRYSEAGPDFKTLTFERIEAPGWAPMANGQPFVLMIGRVGCSEAPAMPVALIAVTY